MKNVHIPQRQRHCRSPQQRLILGLFIIIIGALSLVDNLGYFNTQQILSFWPVVFIILGVLKVTQARHTSGYVFGTLLLGFGLLLTLQNLGIIVFHWRQWWPVLIIGAGISYMFKGFSLKNNSAGVDYTNMNTTNQSNNEQNFAANSSDTISIVAILSGSKTSNASPNFRGGEVSSFMGGAEIDLSKSSIQNEAVIQVFAVFGSIEIRVPDDWTVVLNGVPILGGIEDHSVPPMNSTKRLVISGVVIMGGIEIKN